MSGNNSNNDGCRVILIKDKNPYHPLSGSVRRYIYDSWKDGMEDDSVRCMVLMGEGSQFSAGADITEFGDADAINEISLTELCECLEKSSKPIVAAIDGVALGGGLELALACHVRIATSAVKLGLPEVTLGLIPGAGGTQRLPRLVGIPTALQWILTGQTISASQALQHNLISQIIATPTESLLEAATQWAQYCTLMDDISHLQTCNLTPPHHLMKDKSYEQVCQVIGKQCRVLPKDMGGEAQHAVMETVSYSMKSFDDGMKKESELFWDLLLNSKQSKALCHVFTAQRKVTHLLQKPPKDHPLIHPANKAIIGVVGAGTMGSGIAASFLLAGYSSVILVDTQSASLQRGAKLIQSILLKRKKEKQSNCLKTTTNIQDLQNCHLVVEAVFEKLELKQSIFQQLDTILKQNPTALLVTNTSTMDIEKITSKLPSSRQPFMAGMHFFSPAHVMKLVEIVKTPQTSLTTIALLQSITKRMKKVGVVVNNSKTVPGFVGNRMIAPYTAEACIVLVEHNVTVSQVDTALTKGYFGMPMGPLSMGDLAGNDIGYLIRKSQNLTNPRTRKPTNLRYSSLGDDLVTQLQRVGQKAQKGWYDYSNKKKTDSSQVSQLIQQHRLSSKDDAVLAFSNQTLSNQDIVYKVLFPLVNEGFKLLEEGVAQHPTQVDIIYLYGYGWPAWRGGPMYWADFDVGLSLVLRKLQEWAAVCKRHNLSCPHYEPSKLLQHCVQQKITLHDYFDKKQVHKKQLPSSKL